MKNETKPNTIYLKGQVASPGLAVGKAILYGSTHTEFPRYWISNNEVESEINRFEQSLANLKKQLEEVKRKLCQIEGKEPINILDSHILILKDELLVSSTRATIETEHINAEWALNQSVAHIDESFSKMNHSYFRERRYDLLFIGNALIKNMLGKGEAFLKKMPRGSLVVAHDPSPAEILNFLRFKIAGIIIEAGSSNSHTAIVAKALQIPAIVNIKSAMGIIKDQDYLILDAKKGLVIINPQKTQLQNFQKQTFREKINQSRLISEAKSSAITKDGGAITVFANMEFADELAFIKEYGASGIGLYRTEFLFMDRPIPPTIAEQTSVYKKILSKMAPHDVVIRTLDLGADKLTLNQKIEEANPALGLRAIRLSLHEKEMFKDQLRALYLASPAGNLKICFPMITSTDEFREVKKIVHQVVADLKKEGHKINPHIPLGIMIETPSAVLELDYLCMEADFFSLGTNDLMQYTLAVDRTNDLLSPLYSPCHPSIIRLLNQIVQTTNRYKKELTLCGEMAGDPEFLLLLLGLGFTRLSMNSASIPRIKKMIRQATLTDAVALTKTLIASSSVKDNKKINQQKIKNIYPEY